MRSLSALIFLLLACSGSFFLGMQAKRFLYEDACLDAGGKIRAMGQGFCEFGTPSTDLVSGNRQGE